MNQLLVFLRLLIAVASASSVCGCGSDDGEGTAGSGGSSGATSGGGDDPCLLQVVLSGAVTEDISWDGLKGCGGGSTPEAMTVGFGITNPTKFKLTVFGITEGQPGTGTSAQVRVTKDDLVWTTAEDGCQAELTSFELEEENDVGKNYRVAGSGSCTTAADITENGATGAVTIGDFTFASVTLY